MPGPNVDALHLGIVLVVGVVAGFINAVAGGGSLLTLPAFIFLGLPSNVANGTNRIGVLLQSAASSEAFRREKVLPHQLALRLTLVAAPGAILGARFAVTMDDALFRRVLALIMVGVLVIILRGGRRRDGDGGPDRGKPTPAAVPHPVALYVTYALAGLYAGFIQAGVGFLIIAILTSFGGLNLIETNAVKVLTVLFQQVVALIVFVSAGAVHWGWGFAMAVGMMAGGWAGVRWQVAWGEVWVRRFLAVCIVAFAIKLLLPK